jgi:hypothetical protein
MSKSKRCIQPVNIWLSLKMDILGCDCKANGLFRRQSRGSSHCKRILNDQSFWTRDSCAGSRFFDPICDSSNEVEPQPRAV